MPPVPGQDQVGSKKMTILSTDLLLGFVVLFGLVFALTNGRSATRFRRSSSCRPMPM
jgi:hypothetical protein